MKKFIYWVSLIAVIVLINSCREAEELTTISDQIQYESVSSKVTKDSIGINPNTSNESNSRVVQESDPPPKKDEINW